MDSRILYNKPKRNWTKTIENFVEFLSFISLNKVIFLKSPLSKACHPIHSASIKKVRLDRVKDLAESRNLTCQSYSFPLFSFFPILDEPKTTQRMFEGITLESYSLHLLLSVDCAFMLQRNHCSVISASKVIVNLV